MAAYLDSLHLPPRSVLTDTSTSYAVVVASADLPQFVVSSDLDFLRVLNDPRAYGVRYLLTIANEGRGTTDALNRRYPALYATGGGIASFELEFDNSGLDRPTYRLFRVIT